MPTLDDSAQQIDAIVARFMAAFEIPGVAIAIVQPDRPNLRAYGVRKQGDPAPVDIHTQFAIASNSKAFLTACLAMLVDEKKLAWDDRVTFHLPEFQMYDPAVTAMITVRDLLVHRSGLPLGAGDLMQVPPTDHSAEDMLHALRFLKPVTGFRAGYAYDNIVYIVAGLVLQRVSGLSWDEFVLRRIFAPLRMNGAVSNTTLMTGPNRAARHARLGPPTRGLGRLEVVPPSESALIGPAGDWRNRLRHRSLAEGATGVRRPARRQSPVERSTGWRDVESADDHLRWSGCDSGASRTLGVVRLRAGMGGHRLSWAADAIACGGLAGQVTRTTLLPEIGTGLVVFTNCEDSDALSGLRYAVLDVLLGNKAPFDWLARTQKARAGQVAQGAQLLGNGDFKAPSDGPTQVLDCYAGRYRDNWYGDVVITMTARGSAIAFTRTPAFKGPLEAFGPDCFRTLSAWRWRGRNSVLRDEGRRGRSAGAPAVIPA
ncbi:MAG: serine hydrolase [Janthinobacterium lividum]